MALGESDKTNEQLYKNKSVHLNKGTPLKISEAIFDASLQA